MSAGVGRGVCERCAQGILSRDGDGAWDGELPGDCVCRHHCAYPERLRGDPLAPDALCVRGGARRLRSLLARPVAVLLGVRRASDYGVAIARELADALAKQGVTVAGALDDGSGAGGLEAAVRARGGAVAVLADDVRRCSPALCGTSFRRVVERGCAISVPADVTQPLREERRPALIRTLALLADAVIVVEAGAGEQELAIAEACRSCAVPLAAVPGRIDSATSRGANLLIDGGAMAICGIDSAIGLLDNARKRPRGQARRRGSQPAPGSGLRRRGLHRRSREPTAASEHMPTKRAPRSEDELDSDLAQTLERVRLGEDTLDALRAGGGDTSALELTLAELELHGLLRRGIGGRYVPIAEAGSTRRLRGCVSSCPHPRLPARGHLAGANRR